MRLRQCQLDDDRVFNEARNIAYSQERIYWHTSPYCLIYTICCCSPSNYSLFLLPLGRDIISLPFFVGSAVYMHACIHAATMGMNAIVVGENILAYISLLPECL